MIDLYKNRCCLSIWRSTVYYKRHAHTHNRMCWIYLGASQYRLSVEQVTKSILLFYSNFLLFFLKPIYILHFFFYFTLFPYQIHKSLNPCWIFQREKAALSIQLKANILNGFVFINLNWMTQKNDFNDQKNFL